MNAANIVSTIHSAQNEFLGYVLTTLEAVLPTEAQFKAVRKLLLDKHGTVTRKLEKQLLASSQSPEITRHRDTHSMHPRKGG